MCHNVPLIFSGDRSGQKAGQFSSCTELMENVLHSEIRRDVPVKGVIWMEAYSVLLQNLYVHFSFSGAFTDVQVTHGAMGTNTPINHHRCWLLNFVVAIMSMVLLPFTSKGHNSSLTIWCLVPSDQKTLFYFASVHLRWAWVPRTLYMSYTLHISFLTSNFRCNGPFSDNEPREKLNKWKHTMLTSSYSKRNLDFITLIVSSHYE